MQKMIDRQQVRSRVRRRIRLKLSGTAAQPRLAVFRSLKHIYAQAIDDESGRTLVSASSRDKELSASLKGGGNVEAAKQVGTLIARRLKEAGVETIVFDRGGFIYHGRVRALADAAREGGLKF